MAPLPVLAADYFWRNHLARFRHPML